jgi:sulfate adenylyltransferase
MNTDKTRFIFCFLRGLCKRSIVADREKNNEEIVMKKFAGMCITPINYSSYSTQRETFMHKSLIQPHGGKLVDRSLQGIERETAFERAHLLPRLTLSQRNLANLECIATGLYSPLEGFVDEKEYYNIVNNMRLGSGLAWSIPVTLQVPQAACYRYRLDDEIALAHPNGDILAVMSITSKFKPDQDDEAKKVYGTTEEAHPGVHSMRTEGQVYLGGPITLVNTIPHNDFQNYRLTPVATRAEFVKRQWNTIVAFQTRNPIHRAHEYITKIAMELVDGLFINPLVGCTKPDDIPASVRMQCYETLIAKYYPKHRTLLGVFPAAMRYAGPREAIMHAIARQNYGCTHFIVGRDHARVGSYYGTYDAQHIFDEFRRDELEIIPLKFEHAFYCTRTQSMATAKSSPSTPEERIHLSGTKVREMLSRGQVPPPEFTRPEVAEILVASMMRREASSYIA